MNTSRVKQDKRNKTARDKRAFNKINTNIQEPAILESIKPIEPDILESIKQIEPALLESIKPIEPALLEYIKQIEPDILEPIKPNILEPIKQIEPAISKMELLANRRRETLAVARSKIKPKGFYKDEIQKRDQEIMTLKRMNITLYEMATLNIKPDLLDEEIPDYIYDDTKPQQPQRIQQQIPQRIQQQIQQPQQIQKPQQIQQIQQPQQIQQQQQEQPIEYLANHLYAQTLQKQLKKSMFDKMMNETFQ